MTGAGRDAGGVRENYRGPSIPSWYIAGAMTPPDSNWHAAAPPSDRPSPAASEAEARWPRLVLEASALLAVLCCLALAALWFVRHPVLNAFDEVGHITNTLSDALMLRRGEFTVLRDALFLWNRWLPPGLRVVGLPVAAAAGDWGAEALRLSAAAMFLLTVGALWMALRPVAGRGGAAAAVLLYALSPVNLFGAQNFMTEAVLHLCAALALWLLIAEARSPRASVVRMGLLGPVLGLGTLTKLTFLPALGLVWAGVALHGWWRRRDGAALAVRLLLPLAGLLAVAWPHYILNGTRYIGYAKATAAGFAYSPWEETGVAFLLRAARSLVGDVFGPAGAVALLAGLAVLPYAWRRLSEPQRLVAVLAALAATPTLVAYLGSRNQTDRYLGMTLIGASVLIALGIGGVLRAASSRRFAGALAGAVGAATLAQTAWALLIAWQGPAVASTWAGTGLVHASWRENFHCDHAEVPQAVPPVEGTTKVAVFGTSYRVNEVTIRMAFLKAGRRVAALNFPIYATELDWDAVVTEAAQQDAIVLPLHLEPSEDYPVNRFIPEFEARLAAAGVALNKRVDLQGGRSPTCATRVLVPVPGSGPRPARTPLRSEVNPLP